MHVTRFMRRGAVRPLSGVAVRGLRLAWRRVVAVVGVLPPAASRADGEAVGAGEAKELGEVGAARRADTGKVLRFPERL